MVLVVCGQNNRSGSSLCPPEVANQHRVTTGTRLHWFIGSPFSLDGTTVLLFPQQLRFACQIQILTPRYQKDGLVSIATHKSDTTTIVSANDKQHVHSLVTTRRIGFFWWQHVSSDKMWLLDSLWTMNAIE